MSKLLLCRDVIFAPMAPYVPRRGNILEESYNFMLSSYLAPTLMPSQPPQLVCHHPYKLYLYLSLSSFCVTFLASGQKGGLGAD
jgi:hypothetical protein